MNVEEASTRDASAPSDAGGARQDGAVIAEGGGPVVRSCAPGPSPLRRLSHFEYDNTIRDLLDDTARPASSFADESTVNGFANDGTGREVSLTLVESYATAAADVAARATDTPSALAKLASCASAVTTASAAACTRTIVETFGARAFRRPLAIDEVDDLVALHSELQADGADFPTAVAAVIRVVLQSPEFLYRVELGMTESGRAGVRRPTGDEMAARLSYLFWGSTPDDALRAASRAGELVTPEGVKAQASRLIADPRARAVVRYFFNKLFALDELSAPRDGAGALPPAIVAAMREEGARYVDEAVFEHESSWPLLMTSSSTWVNGPLAAFYGVTGIEGDAFVKVSMATDQRAGLLTQGGVMAAGGRGDGLDAMRRGALVANRLLCRGISPVHTTEVLARAIPIPEGLATPRQRVEALTAPAECRACHDVVNPLGFALDHYDAAGRYRAVDGDGGPAIDARVEVPGIPGVINGGVELARKLAELPEAQNCFAEQWLAFAHGRSLAESDVCLRETAHDAFRRSGYDVRRLLIDLTQTDAFLFLPAKELP